MQGIAKAQDIFNTSAYNVFLSGDLLGQIEKTGTGYKVTPINKKPLDYGKDDEAGAIQVLINGKPSAAPAAKIIDHRQGQLF